MDDINISYVGMERDRYLEKSGAMQAGFLSELDEISRLSALLCKATSAMICFFYKEEAVVQSVFNLKKDKIAIHPSMMLQLPLQPSSINISIPTSNFLTMDGEKVNCRCYIEPVRIKKSLLVGAVVVLDQRQDLSFEKSIAGLDIVANQISEILEKQINQLSLKDNEVQFREAFQHSSIGMAIVALRGKILKVNPRIVESLGYTEEELLSKHANEITHVQDIGKEKEAIVKSIKGRHKRFFVEKRYVTKKGKVIWVLLNVYLVRNLFGKPEHFICQIENISKRKSIEENLIKVNRDLLAILSSGYVSIIGTDVQGVIKYFSKGAENLLGYKAKEMVGIKTPYMFHDPEEVKEKGEALSKEYSRKISGFDIFIYKSKMDGFESTQWTYIDKYGKPFQVQLVVTPIYDERKNITGYLGVAMDIQDKVENEEKLQNLAEQLQKQNTQLANFSNIISHNLRSPVNNLKALMQLYNGIDTPSEREEIIEKFEIVIGHLSEILNEIIESLKIRSEVTMSTESVDFEAVLQKMQDIFAGQLIKTQANLTFHFNLKKIEYNHIYLESIFLNLFSNAIKYRSKNRTLSINIVTEMTDLGPILTFSDNGSGIDLDQNAGKIFGFKNTFHDDPNSKGVGLFMIKSQIEALGGKITIESAVDKGTTFKIYFSLKK